MKYEIYTKFSKLERISVIWKGHEKTHRDNLGLSILSNQKQLKIMN